MEKKQTQEVARPLKVLVPLIKQDLHDGAEAAPNAGMQHYIAAGQKLLEAKSQLNAISWGEWLRRNFHLTQDTARQYMKAANKAANGEHFSTMNQVRGDRRKFGHAPDWTHDVRETLRDFDTPAFTRHVAGIDKEQKLEEELALKLIDIGYKVLVVQMHPDKGGTSEGMQRLNKVRDHLKEAA
jgi:hypothetical protein